MIYCISLLLDVDVLDMSLENLIDNLHKIDPTTLIVAGYDYYCNQHCYQKYLPDVLDQYFYDAYKQLSDNLYKNDSSSADSDTTPVPSNADQQRIAYMAALHCDDYSMAKMLRDRFEPSILSPLIIDDEIEINASIQIARVVEGDGVSSRIDYTPSIHSGRRIRSALAINNTITKQTYKTLRYYEGPSVHYSLAAIQHHDIETLKTLVNLQALHYSKLQRPEEGAPIIYPDSLMILLAAPRFAHSNPGTVPEHAGIDDDQQQAYFEIVAQLLQDNFEELQTFNHMSTHCKELSDVYLPHSEQLATHDLMLFLLFVSTQCDAPIVMQRIRQLNDNGEYDLSAGLDYLINNLTTHEEFSKALINIISLKNIDLLSAFLDKYNERTRTLNNADYFHGKMISVRIVIDGHLELSSPVHHALKTFPAAKDLLVKSNAYLPHQTDASGQTCEQAVLEADGHFAIELAKCMLTFKHKYDNGKIELEHTDLSTLQHLVTRMPPSFTTKKATTSPDDVDADTLLGTGKSSCPYLGSVMRFLGYADRSNAKNKGLPRDACEALDPGDVKADDDEPELSTPDTHTPAS